jgi:hypothetical protein
VNPGPSGEHIIPSKRDTGLEILAQLFNDPADLFLSCNGILFNVAGRVRSADEGVAKPWEVEKHPTIRRSRIYQTDICWGVMTRVYDMYV